MLKALLHRQIHVRTRNFSFLARTWYSILTVQNNNVVQHESKWEAIIGLEVHAQINSNTKLFSSSPNSFNEPVNTNISIIDAAFPGVQPKLNEKCVELTIKTAMALQGQINAHSSFDRKHYFYADLPQGYQITQHYEPISRGGKLTLDENDGLPYSTEVRIEQIQLEQDTGKSIHDIRPGIALVDLNRAGTGLMEIVMKPDLRSSTEAGLVVRKLQALLRTVGSSNGNMEEGSLRCDVNVSVHKLGTPFGTRCEIKNLNSVRFLMAAIDVEIQRQIDTLERGEPVLQETRGYDAVENKTFRLRSKETSPDYRYMPEPDLPKLILSKDFLENIGTTLPELPDDKRKRIMRQYGLAFKDVNTLLGEAGAVEYFERLCANPSRSPRNVFSWMTHELFGQLNMRAKSFRENTITVDQLGSLIDSINNGTISGAIGKKVLTLMVNGDSRRADEIIEEKDWKVIGDEMEVNKVVDEILAENQDKVEQIHAGKVALFNYIVGMIMKRTKGRGDPALVNKVLEEKLGIKK